MKETKEVIEKIKRYGETGAGLRLDNREIGALISALELAEEKGAVLSSIIESSDDAIISKDLDGMITSWNKAAGRIFGYRADEMVGSSILKLIPSHLHGEEPEILSQLSQGIRIDHFETQRLRRDGTLVDVSLTISPIYGPDGTVTGVSKIARDMTLHRKAEVDGNRLAAIIASSDDAVISKDLNGMVTSWNASAARIFGYAPEEMIGQSILKIIPQERHPEEAHILSQLRQGIRIEHFETQRIKKDGSPIHVSLTISPIRNREGGVIGLSKIARDITDKKLLEKKKDEFVGLVSHELKTPLTTLKSYIQMASARSQDQHFVANALSRADSQVKKMENMITDFLNISRFEDGHIRIERSVFDVVGLLRECIADAGMTSQRHRVLYEGADSFMVHSDREKISMVVTNLISNAQKYSPRGGDVKVSCQVQRQGVLIKISDQGIGISPKDRELMFRKFHRISSEQTRLIPGFGIGLYLVSTILELHGSAIGVVSEEGKGSTFSFSLQAAEK